MAFRDLKDQLKRHESQHEKMDENPTWHLVKFIIPEVFFFRQFCELRIYKHEENSLFSSQLAILSGRSSAGSQHIKLISKIHAIQAWK